MKICVEFVPVECINLVLFFSLLFFLSYQSAMLPIMIFGMFVFATMAHRDV